MRPRNRASFTPLLALLASGCMTGPISIGNVSPFSQPASSLVTPGGLRVAMDPERLPAIRQRILAQFETISCTQTITPRARRRPTPLPGERPIPRPGTWNDWYAGHEHDRSRIGYCFYGGAALGAGGPPSYTPGAQDSTINVSTSWWSGPTYPWETLELEENRANIAVWGQALVPQSVYAFLELMRRQGRLERWLPEAADADELAQERAILDATADAWMLMRGAYTADPDPVLDELLVARETGRLDAFLLVRRPDTFPEQRAAWSVARPGAAEDYLAWYREVFGVLEP